MSTSLYNKYTEDCNCGEVHSAFCANHRQKLNSPHRVKSVEKDNHPSQKHPEIYPEHHFTNNKHLPPQHHIKPTTSSLQTADLKPHYHEPYLNNQNPHNLPIPNTHYYDIPNSNQNPNPDKSLHKKEIETRDQIIKENEEKIKKLFHDNTILKNKIYELDELREEALTKLERNEYEFQLRLQKEVESSTKKEYELNERIVGILKELNECRISSVKTNFNENQYV